MQSLMSTLSALRVNIDKPTANPVDVYRIHLTKLLAGLTGAAPAVIYPALQLTQTLAKGDLSLAVPALRLKGRKPDDVAQMIQNEVSSCSPPVSHRTARPASFLMPNA